MTVIKLSPSEMRATLEYWTPARIAAATPFSSPQVEIPARSQQKDDEFSKAEAEMFFCNATLPRLMNLKNDILKKSGRLYYLNENNKISWATAQFVGSNYILMTAAHCIKNPRSRGHSKNFMFMRSFQNGRSKQIIPILISAVNLPPAWNVNLNRADQVKWDYAFIQTTKPSSAGHFRLSLSMPDKVKSIGYPDIYQYKYLSYVNGIKEDIGNGRVSMSGNFMGDGSDGGAWILWTGGDKVFSLNAKNNGVGGIMYGPVFDGETQFLLNNSMSPCNIS